MLSLMKKQNQTPNPDINNNDQNNQSDFSGDVGENPLVTITNLINRYLKDIEKTKKDLQEKRTMFTDSYSNDSAYHEAEEKNKEITKNKNKIKEQITRSEAVSKLNNEVKDMRQELKEMEISLSDYLKRYQELTHATTFESDRGDLMEIVQTVKLVKKSKKE